MFSYYVTYRTEAKTTPAGIIAMETAQGHALMWDHRAKAWVYDPALAVRFLDDHRNWDRYETVERELAERVAPEITGGERLPDEDSIRWIFRWRGNPPEYED